MDCLTQQQARTLLQQYNNDYYDGELVFIVQFTPMKRSAGRYRNTDKTITISTHLLAHTAETVRTVLKHELAHAAVDQLYGRKKPHGREWYDEMTRMGIADPSVTHDLQLAEYTYVFECDGCGATVGRFRRCKFVEQFEDYRCRNCGSGFTQIKSAAQS